MDCAPGYGRQNGDRAALGNDSLRATGPQLQGCTQGCVIESCFICIMVFTRPAGGVFEMLPIPAVTLPNAPCSSCVGNGVSHWKFVESVWGQVETGNVGEASGSPTQLHMESKV